MPWSYAPTWTQKALPAPITMLECGFESSVNLNTLAYYALTVEDDYQQALAYAERAKGMAEE